MKNSIKKRIKLAKKSIDTVSLKAYFKFKENDGMGTIEVVLIAVSLIALVIIFKEQVTRMLEGFLAKMQTKANSIF